MTLDDQGRSDHHGLVKETVGPQYRPDIISGKYGLVLGQFPASRAGNDNVRSGGHPSIALPLPGFLKQNGRNFGGACRSGDLQHDSSPSRVTTHLEEKLLIALLTDEKANSFGDNLTLIVMVELGRVMTKAVQAGCVSVTVQLVIVADGTSA